MRYKTKVQYLPMIGGYRKVAADHGWSLRTRVVHENDQFDVELGADENVIHVPVRPGQEPGPMVAAYAVAKHRDGRRELEVMHAADIEKARNVSRAKDSGPWTQWPERMWEKTVGKRLFLKLPLADEDSERIKRMLQAEAELEPVDAAVSMYGEQARPRMHQLEQASPAAPLPATTPQTPPPPATDGDGQPSADAEPAAGNGGGAAAQLDEESGAPVVNSDVTGSAQSRTTPGEPVPEPPDAEPPEPPPPAEPAKPAVEDAEKQLELAGATVVPNRREDRAGKLRYSGKTVLFVEGKDPDWLDWLLQLPATAWKQEFRAAVENVVGSRVTT